jgi:aryl-alcohol dehydrogenase-like predicted oxidoreductase
VRAHPGSIPALRRAEAQSAAGIDRRRRNPEFRDPLLGRNLALRDALRPIAARHGVSVAAVAVAWTLSWQDVSGAIVGARSPAQVDGWIAAGELTLEAEDLSEIAAALERTRAGAGPLQPRGQETSPRRSAGLRRRSS